MADATALHLTEHEILALLAFNDTESCTITRDIFRLTPHADNADLQRAGLSTLLVRDLAELDGEDIRVKGPTGFLAAVMATAGEWLEIALITPSTNHVLFAVSSAGGAFVANVSGRATHRFTPLKNEAPILSFGLDAASHFLQGDNAARPAAAQIKHHGLGVEARTANLMVDESGAWHLATGEGDQLAKRDVSSSDALELFGQALTLDADAKASE
ncbi:hypothetical protein GC088_10970 [Arthrobacter sp. JZ12]|uniref:hypothetical protein n=1 Tax=Arthrobacter sp. JZ12 TaxID=2654190 RepID=UPI002B480556|nr:hypothetical protein [Arthrobacter sp. JZ12]WRH25534.1 hypothetical protein GC088_10970 [Arthrobacter sp. JZ12]